GMRRFVARLSVGPDESRARRILDFGCGAGWVGIEAAIAARSAGAARGADVELCAFDPSGAMVELATENARASGIEHFTGRIGFGEAPPFPALLPAPGEPRFDLV